MQFLKPHYAQNPFSLRGVKPLSLFLTPLTSASLIGAVIRLTKTRMKFSKAKTKSAGLNKKTHSSPMQKKDWAKEMTDEEAVVHLKTHLQKGCAWSGNSLVYLNAVWEAALWVAKAEGFESDSNS